MAIATPGMAAEIRHAIDMGVEAPDRVVVMALVCKGGPAKSVRASGIELKRDAIMIGADETAELWSAEMPAGSGEQTFSIADCAEPKTIFWRLDDLKSATPERTCLVSLGRDDRPSVAAVYKQRMVP